MARGLSGIGVFDELDVNGIFAQTIGTITLFDLSGNLINTLNNYRNITTPWPGSTPRRGSVWALNDAIANEIGRIEYDIVLERIPEPTSMALFALGLFGLGVRKFHKMS